MAFEQIQRGLKEREVFHPYLIPHDGAISGMQKIRNLSVSIEFDSCDAGTSTRDRICLILPAHRRCLDRGEERYFQKGRKVGSSRRLITARGQAARKRSSQRVKVTTNAAIKFCKWLK